MNHPHQIGRLLFRYTRRELTKAEEKELIDWRQASPKNEALFLKETDPEHLRKEISLMFESRDYMFRKLKEQFPSIPEEPSVNSKGRIVRMVRIAAIFVIVIGAALYFLINGQSREGRPGSSQAGLFSPGNISHALDDFHRGYLAGSYGIILKKLDNGQLLYLVPNDSHAAKNETDSLYTPRGGQFAMKFPDGTVVWLNAESYIVYPANLNRDTIRVRVGGEAYFEMSNKSAHSYIITLPSTINRQPSTENELVIKTTNAHFDVKNYPDEPKTITLVEDSLHAGLEMIAGQEYADTILHAGEQLQWINQKPSVAVAKNLNDIKAWKDGMSSFHDADIQTIMLAVSRWYDVDVQYMGKIPDKRFNLNLPRDSNLKELLAALEKQGIHLSLHAGRITVSP